MVVVVVMMTIGCFLSDQRFLHRFVFRSVNAGNRGEHHNIKRKYDGKNFHNQTTKIKDNWNFLILFFALIVGGHD